MGPFIKSNNKTSKIMIRLLIALTPIILFAIYKNGYIPYSKGYVGIYGLLYPLIFILVGALTSFIVELVYSLIFIKEDYIKNSYSFFPGLFLSLILPLNSPILVLILGASVATIIGKLVFGGFGKNIFNPALIGYIFVVASFSSVFSSNAYFNSYELDTISKATPLTNASLVTGIGTYDELIKPYGNLTDFFVGTIPGGLGEVSSLLCLLAFVYLSVTKVIKWKIPFVYVLTVFIINFMISRLLGIGIYYPIFSILSGGLMFGSVFMATDPVTSPVTNFGQILYGIFLGILTVLLRLMGVEGVATSILIMNMFVFLLDKRGSKVKLHLSKSLVWVFICFILILSTGVYVASQKRVIGNIDPNFSIISKETNNNETIYVVTQKGYGGSIKAQIKLESDKVTSFEILSQHETGDKYKLVTDANYVNTLMNSNDLNNVDTVSGATITSSALKKMLINVMEDYK